MPKESLNFDLSSNKNLDEGTNSNQNQEIQKKKWKELELEYEKLLEYAGHPKESISPEEYEQIIKLQQELAGFALDILENSNGIPIGISTFNDIGGKGNSSYQYEFEKGIFRSIENNQRLNTNKLNSEELKDLVKKNIRSFLGGGTVFDDDVCFEVRYWDGGWSTSCNNRASLGENVLYTKDRSHDSSGYYSEDHEEISLMNNKYEFNIYDRQEDVHSDEDSNVVLLNGRFLEEVEKDDKELFLKYKASEQIMSKVGSRNEDVSRAKWVLKKTADEFYIKKYGIRTDEYDSARSYELSMLNRNQDFTSEPLRIAKLALFLEIQPEDLLDLVKIKDEEGPFNYFTINNAEWDISGYHGRIEEMKNGMSDRIGWKVNRYDFLKQRSQEIYNHARNYTQKN